LFKWRGSVEAGGRGSPQGPPGASTERLQLIDPPQSLEQHEGAEVVHGLAGGPGHRDGSQTLAHQLSRSRENEWCAEYQVVSGERMQEMIV